MEFFDKLGKKASEAYKMTADKTGKIAKETKLKFRMNELKSQVNDIYEEIGRKVYEKHIREENISIKNDLESECTRIDVLSDEINELLQECLNLKDKKQCPKCYKEIEVEDNFCPNCGAKQTEQQPKEVEILEDLENSEVEQDNETEKQIVIEELENDIREKADKENEKNKEERTSNKKSSKENDDDEMTNLEKTVSIESDVDIEEDEEKEDE